MPDAPNTHQTLHSIDIYVQATAAIGMGHLSRVAALVAQLETLGFACRIAADADYHGRRFARSHHLAMSGELRREAEVVVIDAVDVPTSTARILSAYPTRILISPSFNRADLATHVLVRDAPQELVASLDSGARLDVDPRFAFTTAREVGKFDGDFSDIRVGLCLTGGMGSTAVPVLACLIDAPGIARVTAIGDLSLGGAESRGPRLRHTRFTDDPWRFLAGSNVFVGGDGVMVGEAVARALPTFSVTTHSRLGKNRGLIEAGAIEVVLSESLDCRRLQRLVSDRDLLHQLHSAAGAAYQPSDSQALAAAIKGILDG